MRRPAVNHVRQPLRCPAGGLDFPEIPWRRMGSTRENEMHFPRNEVGEQVAMVGYTAVKQ